MIAGGSVIEYDLAHTGSAWFSECRRYRYSLRRCFAGTVDTPPIKPIVFLMLNPSTADAFKLDPTIRRCVGFAQAWGYSDLIVANLFAIRETDSKKLRQNPERVGPANDAAIEIIGTLGCPIIAAWGAHPLAADRARDVLYFLRRPLLCLRKTEKTGAPEHPLYIPGDISPQPWEPRS